jgi:N-methylhydantoinase B
MSQPDTRSTRALNPKTMGIVRSGLSVVADAIGITTIRAAYSTTIKGGADVSGGLFDVHGRLVALSDTSMIGHLAPLRCALRSILTDFPPATIRPGDVFIMNDPYRGGVHSNDMQVFNTIFIDGSLRFLAGAMVHVADVGGTAPGGLSGTVTDMFQEGLTLPPVRLYENGEPVTDTFNIIAANTRTPDVTLGDVRALMAGTQAGERELHALIARLGDEGFTTVDAGIDALLAYTEERTRIRIRELGPGSASGEAVIDDDGVRLDLPLKVQVTITIDGSQMIIDFTGTDNQAVGPISAPEGPAVSAAVYGAMVLLDDPDIPVNEGLFAPLLVVRPEGSLVAPRRPAGANARGITMLAMIDAMVDAMAKLHPDRAIAGCDLNHVWTLSTKDGLGRTKSFHDRDYGGAGARQGSNGVDAHGYAVFAGRTSVVPMEIIEEEHAVMFECLSLRPGSGGVGRWHGGRGVVKRVRVLDDANLTVRTDKITFPPKGIEGGGDGQPGGWIINAGTSRQQNLRSKETNIHLKAGDTVTMLTSGGGGFGAAEVQI